MLQDPADRFRARIGTAVRPGAPATTPAGLADTIHLSTVWERGDAGTSPTDPVYGRLDNPTLRSVEATIAALEGGAAAMLFGSGMAAAIELVSSFAAPARIVVSDALYYGLRGWLAGLGRDGHRVVFVDTTDLDAVEAACTAVRPDLVWIETPSNPLWRITDVAAVAERAHTVGAMVCVDSTAATPVFTRPIILGADLVMHSATKYLNGHNDVAAGVLIAATPGEVWTRVAERRAVHGVGLGAMDAWLLARGLKTLDVRVRAQAASATILAHCLAGHPSVAEVFHPSLPDHPGHAVAVRQMIGGFGGMLSFRPLGGRGTALAVAASLGLWRRATSFGGIESLVEHRASMEGAGPHCPDDLLRLSVGLEDVDELWTDLDRALVRLDRANLPSFRGDRR